MPSTIPWPEWRDKYAQRIQERTSGTCPIERCLEIADDAKDWFHEGDDPIEAADEELSYWDVDE